jgi:hypothetical protein
MHLLVILQWQAANILSVPATATYEDTVGAVKGSYRNYQLAAAHRRAFGPQGTCRVVRRLIQGRKPMRSSIE